MRTSTAPNPDIPIFLATLSPRMLALTGEIADGRLGTSFVPEGAAAYLDPLRSGAQRAGRTLADLDLCQGAEGAFAADERELAGMVAARKPGIAFSLGGMGTAASNFYFDAYRRQGWGERADRVRALWPAGDRLAAADPVGADMVLGTTLLGRRTACGRGMGVWRDAGITTVRLYPAGDMLADRLQTLGRAVDMVRGLTPRGAAPGP